LAATIKSVTGVEPELVCGGGGIFDVVVDGDMIFSKHESDRFPEPDEILSRIRNP
jgi:selT/selW/selH-like putative selenoprotein